MQYFHNRGECKNSLYALKEQRNRQTSVNRLCDLQCQHAIFNDHEKLCIICVIIEVMEDSEFCFSNIKIKLHANFVF